MRFKNRYSNGYNNVGHETMIDWFLGIIAESAVFELFNGRMKQWECSKSLLKNILKPRYFLKFRFTTSPTLFFENWNKNITPRTRFIFNLTSCI